jgi:hypothetical protein
VEPDGGHAGGPHVPDELVEGVLFAAAAGLEDLPGFVIVIIVGGLADGLLNPPAQAVVAVRGG